MRAIALDPGPRADGHRRRRGDRSDLLHRLGTGGAAGVMAGAYYGKIDFLMGFIIGLKAFTAAVIGGIGNIPGAMLGGLGARPAGVVRHALVGGQWRDVFAFGVLILFLTLRPTGTPRRARHGAGLMRRSRPPARRTVRAATRTAAPGERLQNRGPGGRCDRAAGAVRQRDAYALSVMTTAAHLRHARRRAEHRGRLLRPARPRATSPSSRSAPTPAASSPSRSSCRCSPRCPPSWSRSSSPGSSSAPHPAPAQRLPRDRDPGFRRDHPDHREQPAITGGPSGISASRLRSAGSIPHPVSSTCAVVVVARAVLAAARLGHSRLGRAWRFVREDEDAAEAMGIHTYKVKLPPTSSAPSGEASPASCSASHLTGGVADELPLPAICTGADGGGARWHGLEARSRDRRLVISLLPELLRDLAEYRYLMFGVLLVVVMVFRPQGLWPRTHRKPSAPRDDLSRPRSRTEWRGYVRGGGR